MKRTFRLLTIVLFYLIFTTSALGQKSYQEQRDSLLQEIKSSEGEEKLKAYSSLTGISFPNEEIDLKLKYIEDFILEAQLQQNKEYENKARSKELSELFNHDRIDDFQEKANKHLLFFKAHNFTKTYYDKYYLLLLSYGIQGDEERVIREAKLIYEEAKSQNSLFGIAKATDMLARVYSMEKRYAEAEIFIKETLSTSKELFEEEPDDRDIHFLVLYTYRSLINILIFQDKFDEIFSFMPEWKLQLAEYEKTFGEICLGAQMEYYDFNARIYSNLNEYDKAEAYCDSVMQMNPNPGLLDRIWEYKSMICEGRKEYDKAIYWIDKTIEHNTQKGELNATVVFIRNKARILCKMGRGEEAWPLFDLAFHRNDSIRSVKNNAQLDELRTVYEVDKITTEKEKTRNYLLFALGGCVLLIITLGIWIYYHRKIAKKNKTLVYQIKELQIQQEMQEKDILNKSSFISDNQIEDDFCPEKRKDQLCITIRDIILKEKAYRNPSINRDTLIDRLGTNKDLFVEAFQYCFGMSFPEFINSLRLKDAIALLEQSDLSIEAISEKVGFGTVRTFQRQFQAKYNMSPKAYRKLAHEK
jgi:AraC-like DNA-binding protein